MTYRVWIVIVSLASACGPSGDPLLIHYAFTSGSEQSCSNGAGGPINDCGDAPMTCDSVALLRIIDPNDNTHVYVDQCLPIPNSARDHNLCPIAQTFTPMETFPTSRVEVQLAIYPHAIPGVMDGVGDDLTTGDPVCPTKIEFTTSGFAAPGNTIMPAYAGRAFADGFDNEVTVELGCSDPGLLNTDYCRDENALDVTASVLDFDQQVSVSTDDATNLSVRVGQPQPVGTNWVFDIADTAELPLLSSGTNPEWAADNLDVDLVDYACIQVLEFIGGAVASLNCRTLTAPVPTALDLIGYRVTPTTVEQVLTALGFTNLPNEGLVIGIVFGPNGTPAPGAMVMDQGGSEVEYLSADGMSVGGTSTSSKGIFVSGISGSPDDAPFEIAGAANHWQAMAPNMIQANDPVGGRVNFRLSVVVIQMNQTPR